MGYSTKRSNRHFLRATLSRSISSVNHTTVRHEFSIPALRSLATGRWARGPHRDTNAYPPALECTHRGDAKQTNCCADGMLQHLALTSRLFKVMKHPSENQSQEVLAGLVERVTYHNVENGFWVLGAKVRVHRDVVTVVGHAATIAAGEWITASGEWVNDRTHGQQFKARFLRTSPPTSADGIEKYLSSGMIRGIGPAYARKLLRAFGEKVFDVIEATPDRLREVDGIGPVRASRITAAWAEQKAVREIMVFLHSHGVGTARAVRIYKTYGPDAIQVMTENPYRLARDIRGIGFKTADAIAMKLGIEKAAMVRVRAGISYALTEAMDEGHCGLPTEELIPLAEKLLEVPQELMSAGRLPTPRNSKLGREIASSDIALFVRHVCLEYNLNIPIIFSRF